MTATQKPPAKRLPRMKHKHISQWNTGVVAGFGGASVAAGELEALQHRKRAEGHERNQRSFERAAADERAKAKSGPGSRPGAVTASGYEAGPGDAAHHNAMADKYQTWAGRHGTKYPYVTPKLREEASDRAYEHRSAARGTKAGPRPKGGGSSGYGSGRSHGWEDVFRDWGKNQYRPGNDDYHRTADRFEAAANRAKWNARYARSDAKIARTAGLAGGAAGLGLAAVTGAAIAHNNKKWREELHRREHGKFATTGGVKKNMDEFGKFQRETKAGAKWGAVTGAAVGAGEALARHGTGNVEATAGIGALAGAAKGLAVGGGAGAAVASARRAKKRNVPTGAVRKNNENQESVVEKNLSAEEIFSKARETQIEKFSREAKSGMKHGALLGGGLGALSGGLTGSPGAAVGGAVAGAAGGAIQGGIIGAGIKRDKKNKAGGFKKSLEMSAEDIFAAARGDEVAKALWNDVAEGAGKLAGKTKNGAVKGFNVAKPKVAAVGTAAKDKFNSQSLGRRYTAVGAAGVAGGVGLGAAAEGRKNKPAY